MTLTIPNPVTAKFKGVIFQHNSAHSHGVFLPIFQLNANTCPKPTSQFVNICCTQMVQNSKTPSIDGEEEHFESLEVERPGSNREAWTQVILSHLINFNSFGYMLSFGIFQGYYKEVLGFTPSAVSWIGTTQLFLNFTVGVFSGRMMDAGLYKYTLAVGLSLQLTGAFTTSVCTRYYQLFLAQGICNGLGNGLLFCPAVALVSTYFPPSKRAIPLSIVASGGATGGMVFPAIAQSLLYRIGFAWTIRTMGFVMLAASLIVLPFSRPRPQPRKAQPWFDKAAFREAPYLLFCAGIFFCFWGLFFAYYYVRPFGQDILHTSQSTSFTLLLVINSFGIPGRVIPAILADRYFDPLNVIIPFMFVTGFLLYCWIAIKSIPGFYIWVAVYGFFGGGCQSLFQASVSSFANAENAGVRIGMVCSIVSFACLSGPPIAGKLVENLGGGYLHAQLFGASVLVAGSCLLLGARRVQHPKIP
jgi:predicted MFS family arabinose efflux permease